MSRFLVVIMFKKMIYWIVFMCLFVIVCSKPGDRDDPKDICGETRCVGEEYECIDERCYCAPGYIPNPFKVRCVKCPDICGETRCVGEKYECIDERCYCAPGYIPNPFKVRCVKCPGLGENCFSQCCNQYSNTTLHCWQGVCQPCYDAYGNWICRDNMKDILLISTAQVAMGAALVFGIIATFILLYKICAATNIRDSATSGLRKEQLNPRMSALPLPSTPSTSLTSLTCTTPMGNSSNRSRLSIGSLQLYIEERLRDAPPRYTRAAAGGPSRYPATTFVNTAFVHDSSIPPPPYTEQVKTEEPNVALDRHTALHI